MKKFTIEKICSLPIDFKTTNKSAYTLAKESKFEEIYKDITTKDISNYLSIHGDLIDKWEIWSEDKRTTGYGLSISDNYSIFNMNEAAKIIFEKHFASALDACSEYILREVGSILDINVESQIK